MPDRKLCMIPGPIELDNDVLVAMSTPATSHVDPLFVPVFGEVIELLREVIVSTTAQPFVITGSGTLGWDQMVNLLEPEDEVLLLSTGYFGDTFAECLETYGGNVTVLTAPVGQRPTLDQLEREVTSKKYKMVAVTHVDTSTGVLSDIESIAATVKAISPETLVVVDGVCSVGSEEIQFDAWQLDIVITGSQKGLGAPPGLSIVFASQHALNVFKTRTTPVVAYYMHWKKWIPIMQSYEARKPSYFATPAVQLIMALHASLKKITAKSLEERWAIHRQVAAGFRQSIRGLGLVPLTEQEEMAASGLTAVWLPQGIEASQLLPLMGAHGVQIAGGILKDLSAKYFRVGHMGVSVTDENHIEKVLAGLTASFMTLGAQKK
ncbi:pyridoxal phosphate-dependent transferase [Spinellus fusiger]|nr:pyridoxal phosphate-dependent transferase [Spinellus fusiger]